MLDILGLVWVFLKAADFKKVADDTGVLRANISQKNSLKIDPITNALLRNVNNSKSECAHKGWFVDLDSLLLLYVVNL